MMLLCLNLIETNLYIAKMGITTFTGVSGGLVVRASDSEVGGSILTRVAMNIVFLSKIYYSQKVLVILRKRLFRPGMTKNCLPGR